MRADVVSEVIRSGIVESEHRGVVVALDAAGSTVLAVGDVDAPVYPRSSLNPLQAAALVEHGLDLPAELLVLAAASHSGEPAHLDGVRRLLASAGLDESALQCPASLPLGVEARSEWLRRGGGEVPLVMNCSGLHAAMLATCVIRGWPVDTYLAADHPVQRAARATVEALTGEPVAAVSVDGCGTPLFAFSCTGLARAFAALATAPAGSPAGQVAAAIRAYPALLGGTGRDVTRLIEAIPGLVAKDGAEGVYAAALPDGRAVALKILDGAERARPPVLLAALERLGVRAEGVEDLALPPVLGGGAVVGAVRAAAAVRG